MDSGLGTGWAITGFWAWDRVGNYWILGLGTERQLLSSGLETVGDYLFLGWGQGDDYTLVGVGKGYNYMVVGLRQCCPSFVLGS